MSKNLVKNFAKKTGKPEKEIEILYKKAKKEASHMGMGDNLGYTTSILKTMLGIKESVADITEEFLKSEDGFDIFYETLTAGSLESGDIPDTLKYVQRKQDDEEDEDEEGKEYDIVQASPETVKKLKHPKTYK